MRQETEPTAELLEELLVKTSRTFALSIPVLPEPTRRQVTIAYLLFRIADTLEDATEWTPERQVRELHAFGRLLEEPSDERARKISSTWTGQPPLHHDAYLELLAEVPAVLRAFRDLPEAARDVMRHHTLRTIERMASFVERTGEAGDLQLEDIPDLQAYCYAVAGIVGEMLTELFLHDSPGLEKIAPVLRENAARFGEALQLVNILKDSASDAVEGRRYLPDGVELARVFDLARADLEDARRYVIALHEAGAPRGVVAFNALPALLAWKTLDRVQRDGPGSKLTRFEVLQVTQDLENALEVGHTEGLFPVAARD